MKTQRRKKAETHDTARKKPARDIVRHRPTPASALPRRGEKPFWLRHLLAIAAVAAAVLGGLWIAGNTFGSPVAVGSRMVSGVVTDQKLAGVFADAAAAYRLTLQYPNGEKLSYNLADIGMQAQPVASVVAVRDEQRSLLHRLAWWQPVHAELKVRTDNAALQRFISQKATIIAEEPTDAAIAIEDGNVVVTPEKNGRQYSFTNPARSVALAVRGLQTDTLRLTTVAREPKVTAQSLAPTRLRLEEILNQQIHIAIGDDTVTPGRADIGRWITLTREGNDMRIGLNQDELRGYLGNLASEHTKDARSQVISDVTGAVLVTGANGLTVDSSNAVDDNLATDILSARTATIRLPAQATAFKTVYAPTSGKWIEVDTTTKRMYAYDQGQLVRSFLISAGAYGTPTVVGRFAIYAKYASQDMFGANTDGSRYYQPAVPYVNYFYRDYAIHGNYWRPASYFGYINSSHGCVGINVNESAWMYSWAPIGTPVIVHT